MDRHLEPSQDHAHQQEQSHENQVQADNSQQHNTTQFGENQNSSEAHEMNQDNTEKFKDHDPTDKTKANFAESKDGVSESHSTAQHLHQEQNYTSENRDNTLIVSQDDQQGNSIKDSWQSIPFVESMVYSKAPAHHSVANQDQEGLEKIFDQNNNEDKKSETNIYGDKDIKGHDTVEHGHTNLTNSLDNHESETRHEVTTNSQQRKDTESQPTSNNQHKRAASHSSEELSKQSEFKKSGSFSSESKSRNKAIAVEERFKQALEAKERGNEVIKQKKYAEAIEFYKKALSLINPDSLPTLSSGELRDKLNELRISLLNNITQSYLGLKRFEDAHKYAEKVILLDPENEKALYRISLCLENQGRNLEALQNLKQINKLNTKKGARNSAEVVEAYERVKIKSKGELENQNKQEKDEKEVSQMYKRMFSEKKDDIETRNHSRLNLFKRGLFLFPSVGVAYFVLSKVLKVNIKNPKSQLTLSILSASLFGTLASSKTWVKGVFATSFFILTSLVYGFKSKIKA